MREVKSFFVHGNKLNKGYSKAQEIHKNEHTPYKKLLRTLPPLDVLSEYENIHPGTLSKLIEMADREQRHTHAVELATIKSLKPNNLRSTTVEVTGQVLAFLGMLFLYFKEADKANLVAVAFISCIFLGSTVANISSYFIKNRKNNK